VLLRGRLGLKLRQRLVGRRLIGHHLFLQDLRISRSAQLLLFRERRLMRAELGGTSVIAQRAARDGAFSRAVGLGIQTTQAALAEEKKLLSENTRS